MGGWRRGSAPGYWPGRGPFSYLPPWQRPGWLYGPGTCWQFYSRRLLPEAPPAEEIDYLKAYAEELRRQLEEVESRIKRLEETGGEK